MPKPLPSPELLRKLLRYEPDTGKLFWRHRDEAQCISHRAWKIWTGRFSGREAFTSINAGGYHTGSIEYVMFRSHRVIWAIVHGEWPDGQIDHINGARDDNRIGNLRVVSRAQNHRNRKMPKHNTSGALGVYLCGQTGKWKAHIGVNGKQKHLGSFPDMGAAITARKAAEIAYRYHKNHGR